MDTSSCGRNKGINTDLLLDDAALKAALNKLFQLSERRIERTAMFKRFANNQQLRGYGFLSFLTVHDAATAFQNIQNAPKPCNHGTVHAELSHQSTKGNNNKDGK